jgi:phosphoserine aminotransferase
MPEPPHIRLPAELLPADGRFGSGPARIRVGEAEALSATGTSYLGTSHRKEPVRSVVRAVRTGLRELYGLPEGYEVLLGLGGATAFWDAAAFGLIDTRSQHLVFGEFSGKFAAVTNGAPWLDEPEIVEAAPGTHPLAIPDPEVDAYCLTHNETSTGVAMSPTRPGGGPAVVLVDGTSAAGAVAVDPLEFDAYYFSPQKALGSEGGLWVALCSPAAVTRIETIDAHRWIPPFLSLRIALDNSRKDQTYNTPALATLFFLRRQVDWLLDNGGLGWAAERCATNSGLVYAWAESRHYAAPFVEIARQRSTTTPTVDLDDALPVSTVTSVLAANGIVDIGGYRKLGRNQLRIACFPNVAPDDVEKLLAAIDYVAERL